MIHLFVGQDNLSKDKRLNQLKQENLPKNLEHFNFDVLYAKDLKLNLLQEKLLFLPVQLKQRIVVIRGGEALGQEIKDFITVFAKENRENIILVVYLDNYSSNKEFISGLLHHAEVSRFQEEVVLNTFDLSRQIESRKAAASLKILKQLLKNGERPEKILGGLRSSWERNLKNTLELKNRLKLMLSCDLDIKRGRLKPAFALERFIINICSLKKLP